MARSARAASSVPSVNVNFPNNPTSSPSEDDERPLSFWDQVAAVPDHEWWDGGERNKGYRIYCYDEEGPSTYFAVLHEPIDLSWVEQNWGGGVYRFSLNDFDNKFKASTKFRIEGSSKRRRPAVVSANPAPASQDSAMSQMVELIRENNRANREMLQEFMARDRGYGPPATTAQGVDPTAQFKAMVECFQAMLPKQSSPLDDLLKLKQLMGEPKDVLSEIAKLRELGLIAGNSGPGDLGKQLDAMFSIMEKLGITAGGGKSLTEVIAEKAPEVIQGIQKSISEFRQLEETRLQTAREINASQRVQPHPPAQVVPPAPKPLPQSSQPMPQASAAPATQLQVEPISSPAPNPGVVAEITEAQLNQIKMEIVQAIAQGGTGEDLFGYMRLRAPFLLNGMCIFGPQGNVVGVITEDQLDEFCGFDAVLSQAKQFPRYRQTLRELLSEIKFDAMGVDDSEIAPDQDGK